MSTAADTGLFVTLEGIDGAGKSTHVATLVKAFESEGRSVVTTREPGGTVLAETLRGMILNEQMDTLTEALLIFAARRDHLTRVIEPALQQGRVVISDRFTDATFAYQGGGRGFDWNVLSQLETLVQSSSQDEATFPKKMLQPDVTLWFDLDPVVAAQRLAGARVPDKFESQSQAFFTRVAHGYARRMRAAPHRFVRIDAAPDPVRVEQQVLDMMRQLGHLKKGSDA